MKPRNLWFVPAFLAATSAAAMAGDLEIAPSTLDCGGGTSVGAVYELTGTIGQPEAAHALSSATFELRGGFWTAGAGTPCLGDANADGMVNVIDLVTVILEWGMSGPTDGDVDGSGLVNVADMVTVIVNWGPCP